MTITELKKAIVKLNKDYLILKAKENNEVYYTEIKAIESELKRLYFANDTFEGLNSKHVLILLRINLILRVIPLHSFGIGVDLKKL